MYTCLLSPAQERVGYYYLHLRTHSAMNPLIIRFKHKGFVRLMLLKRKQC